MMLDTLPEMKKILNDKYTFNAMAFYSQAENPEFIAMEDLQSLGFQLANRLVGLDLDHSKIALQGLARFHAASVALVEQVCFNCNN